jgi:LacI family transcriptional regulator, gluconate utilization system Gnt-I transcriptional repressor
VTRAARRSTQAVTIAEVASQAGVSPQTVSRSLNTPQLVAEPTLRRVRDAIDQTGYVPNLTAANLASNRSMTVAALIPEISGAIFSETVHALEDVLAGRGYQLFLGSTNYRPEHEEELLRAFLGRRPDGVFVVGTTHTENAARMLDKTEVPVVESWELSDDPIDSVVGFSNADAMRALVQHVKARGYKHPAVVGPLQTGDFRAAKRRDAFQIALRDLYPDEPLRVVDDGSTELEYAVGRALFRAARDRHPEADVLMFSSDVYAVGAILEANRQGVDVPDQVAITGFGDVELGQHLSPGLTTVAVPSRQIGTVAGELLLHRMSGESDAATSVDLGFSIVTRESA